MEQSVINTKIHFPILQPSHIKRHHIEDRLSRDLISGSNFTRKMTLISAPAGYGKTSLAASWMQDIQTEKCWLSIDENDNDPVRFLTYLLKAIQTAAPGTGKASEAILRSPKLPPVETILGPLINELSEVKSILIVTLDDYHLIQSIEIHELMDFFIQNMPVTMHIVIISREDPPFPLHNLRAKNQMEEIRQVDLTFTEDESANFLDEAYAGDISEDNLRLINQRTEGWITGLQLTALSLKNHPNPQEMLKNIGASARYILDYLFQEIFQVQTEKNKDFLLKASIPEQISPELGAAVCGYTDCESILQEITQSNLFIRPIDKSGSWFRFHHLFLELLRQRLRMQKEISTEDLHLKASEWYEANGSMDESVHHAIEGQHWERAAGLISQHSDFLLKNGRITTLLIWLKKIPINIIERSADYCLTYAWPLLLSGNLNEAESFINKAEKAAGQNVEVSGQISAARAYLAQAKGDGAEMVRHSEEALSTLAEDDSNNRGVIALNLGIAYWHAGEMERAEKPLREAIPAAQISSNPYAEISAQLFLARIAAVQGRLIEAAHATREICNNGTEIPIEDLALTDMAIFHYEWNEITEANAYINKAIHSLQRGSVKEFTLAGYMIKIRILMAQRKFKEIKPVIKKCLSLISESKPSERILSRWAALNVELVLSQGNTSEARSWMEKITGDTDAHPFYRFINLTPVRIYLAEENLTKAKDLLDDGYAKAKRKGWNYGMVWLLTRMALCDENESLAVKSLREALGLGFTGNMVRTFVDAGPKLLPLLREVSANHPHPTYIGIITKAIKKESKLSASKDERKGLSEREIEILQLIAAGLTNKQIAEQLVISISTVKSHANHICTKLDAANRMQAAAQARTLGIIE